MSGQRAVRFVKLVGVLLFIYILSRLDLPEVRRTIKSSDPGLIAASLLLFPVFMFFKAWRLKLMLERYGEGGISVGESFRIYMASFFAGVVTPGRLGELSRVAYLGKTGLGLRESLFVVVLDRAVDVFCLLLIGVISAVAVYRGIISATVVGVVLAGVSGMAWRCRASVEGWFARNVLARVASALKRESEQGEGKGLLVRVDAPTGVKSVLLTLLSWGGYFFQCWVIARAIGISLDFYSIVAAVSISSLFALLPISVSGIGTRDAAMVIIFRKFAIPAESAVLFSLSILLLMYLHGLISIIFWIGKKSLPKSDGCQSSIPK